MARPLPRRSTRMNYYSTCLQMVLPVCPLAPLAPLVLWALGVLAGPARLARSARPQARAGRAGRALPGPGGPAQLGHLGSQALARNARLPRHFAPAAHRAVSPPARRQLPASASSAECTRMQSTGARAPQTWSRPVCSARTPCAPPALPTLKGHGTVVSVLTGMSVFKHLGNNN